MMKRIPSAIFRRLGLPYLQGPDRIALHRLERALASVPRYEPGSVEIEGWTMEYVDAASFVSAFETIVVKRQNDFVPTGDSPVILDCGANIGVSVIHYKKLLPKAKIIAFEPDHAICNVLNRNLLANGITDVEVVEAAVWKQNGELEFFSEGADAGRLETSETDMDSLLSISEKGARRRVPAIRLADYLKEPVDFIKLDIEGAESDVLADSVDALSNVEAMIVEFHMTNSRPRELGVVMNALADAHFNVSANSYGRWISLTNKIALMPNSVEFDQYMLLNAWR